MSETPQERDARRRAQAVARQLRYAATPHGKANVRENKRRLRARRREAVEIEDDSEVTMDADGELTLQQKRV
jgi:hypothetical protein